MDEGLRFMHEIGGELRREIFETEMSIFALIDEILSSGLVDHGRLNARWMEERAELMQNTREHRRVRIHENPDKYAITELPDIDCEARMHLCKGRCCTFTFPLSNQDLDERIVKYNYRRPYLIRQGPGPDGQKYCVHNHPETHGCTVYDHRPAVCRTYSCKNDTRVWKDFEARIPNDEDWPPKPDDFGG
jgi:Fe-S-cluster containining protein